MDRLHARYPFLGDARAAVGDAGVDLAALVREGGPAVGRGVERVERALVEGTAAPQERWPARAELLSYPVARVLVSLLDVPGAVEKYARAEAALARERFGEDFRQEIRSGRDERLTPGDLLEDFDLSDAVTRLPPAGSEADAGRRPGARAVTGTDAEAGAPADVEAEAEADTARDAAVGRATTTAESPDGAPVDAGGELARALVDVTTYLRLAADLDGEEWRLVGRELADGRVPVDREELHTFLREAVRRRVAEGLPLDVPEEVAAALDPEVSALRDALAEVELSDDIDTVVPGLFPPCMQALLSRARSDGLVGLPEHSRFSLLTFLVSSGLDADGVMELCGVGDAAAASAVREQVARVGEDGSQFAPPGCEAMDAYGDCVNKDDLCATIAHPLEYYEERLRGAPSDRVVDWRET